MSSASKKLVTLLVGVAAVASLALPGQPAAASVVPAALAAPAPDKATVSQAVQIAIAAARAGWVRTPGSLTGEPGGVTPADCLCGGPGGTASLAHISPWLNSDCDSSVQVGTTTVYAWVQTSGGLVKTNAGWAEWRYSSNRSCHGYQWVRYHLNMTVIHRSTVSGGFATMLWLSQDPLDWTTFTTNFTGGASDGAFSSYAVMAGPLLTTAGIWTSLAQFGPNRNWTSD